MYDIIMLMWYFDVDAHEAYKILEEITDEELEQIWRAYTDYIHLRDM